MDFKILFFILFAVISLDLASTRSCHGDQLFDKNTILRSVGHSRSCQNDQLLFDKSAILRPAAQLPIYLKHLKKKNCNLLRRLLKAKLCYICGPGNSCSSCESAEATLPIQVPIINKAPIDDLLSAKLSALDDILFVKEFADEKLPCDNLPTTKVYKRKCKCGKRKHVSNE